MTTENTTPVNPEPTTPTDKRSAAIAAMNAADPPEAPEGEATAAEAAEPEAPKAKGKKADDAEHEVKATEGVELKTKLRAKLAAAEAKEREIAAERGRLQQEKAELERWKAEQQAALDGDRGKFKEEIAGLRKLAQDDPEAFLKALDWDLNGLVKTKLEQGKPEAVMTKLERQLAEMQARIDRDREELKREREESKRAMEQQQQQAERHRSEQEFISIAATDKYPLLSRLVKKSPGVAVRNAYIVSADLVQENGGKQPFYEDIAARLERELSALRDEEPTITETDDFTNDPPVAKPKAKISPKSNAVPKSVKPVKEMTEREKRLAAIAAMHEFDLE